MARDRRAREGAVRGSHVWSGPKRSRLRRDRPLTWRSALLLLIPLEVLAAGADAMFLTTAMTKCPGCGGYHIRPDIAVLALGLTGFLIYSLAAVWRELRQSLAGKQQPNPHPATATTRERKK